jgi:hypothetical protein
MIDMSHTVFNPYPLRDMTTEFTYAVGDRVQNLRPRSRGRIGVIESLCDVRAVVAWEKSNRTTITPLSQIIPEGEPMPNLRPRGSVAGPLGKSYNPGWSIPQKIQECVAEIAKETGEEKSAIVARLMAKALGLAE